MAASDTKTAATIGTTPNLLAEISVK